MKKIIPVIISAALILSACAKHEENTAADISYETETEKTDTIAAESTAAPSETPEEVTAKINTENAYGKLFGENKKIYNIAFCKDGTYKELSDDEYMAVYLNKLLSDEDFEDYFDDGSENSYEENRRLLLESFGLSEEELSVTDEYSSIFNISGSSDNENEDHAKSAQAVFEYVLKIAEENGHKLTGDDEHLMSIWINYYVQGDIIEISAYGYADSEKLVITENDYISLDGTEVVTIGGYPVSSAVKSIYISAYDEPRATMLDSGASEEYEVTLFDFGYEYGSENAEIDVAELAVNFPELEKLYISAYVTLKNMSAFSEFGSLKELQIDVSGCDDLSMLSEIKTDRLFISGITCPADPLEKLDVKDIRIECTPSDGVLESIYRLKNVSELTINRYSDTEPVLSGIENLSGLKKLDISADISYTVDLSPLAKLENVEDLRIMAYKTKNLDKISEMSSVKKLMLHSMDDDDLAFLSKMTGLEELSLMYVNSSFGPSLQYLKNVKFLSVADITDGADMSRIYQMENLEELMIMGERFNTRGIDALRKLRTLRIMLCSYSDLSGLQKCGELEELMIYNCDTPEFDAKDIEGMTQLKYLIFNCSEISNYEALKTLTGLEQMNLYFCNLSESEMKEVKRALPDCVITTDDGNNIE